MELLDLGCHNPFAGFSPPVTMTESGAWRNDDFPPMHALILASTTQTAGLSSIIVSAEEGISINDSAFNFRRPRIVAPRNIPAGGSASSTLT